MTAGFTGLSFRVWEVHRGSHWQDRTPSPWNSGKYPFGKYLTRALEALTTLNSWCCSERLKAKSEGSTRLVYTGLLTLGTGTPKDRDEVKRREV